MQTPRPSWAVTAVAALATAGVGLIAAGLAMMPPRPPHPGAAGAQPGAVAAPAVPPLPRADPVELRIPTLGVRAQLVPVGADAAGALEVPPLDRPLLAGWYRHGVSPGETGNAVIVGHVDTRAGPAVFFDLGRLRLGDTLEVVRIDDSVATFAVDGVSSYPKERFPTDLVYGPNGASGLRLVTCGGRFDQRSGNYVDNVVVFASRIR